MIRINPTAKKVAGRYWNPRDQQWQFIGFDSMEDAEEWMSDTGHQLEGIVCKADS